MTTQPSAPGLSFPPATYKKIDPKSYLLRHLQPLSASQKSTRPSDRSPEEFRTPTVHTSSLSHAHGSAVVRTGDTAIVCGIRGEILTLRGGEKKVVRSGDHTAEDVLKSYPLLVPNLELNTGCAPQYHPGPPSDLAQALTQRLRHLLVEVVCPVSAESLRITSTKENTEKFDEDDLKGYWVLYIDTVVISLDGNVFDAAWAAIMAALLDTKLPVARWDPDTERIICDPVLTKGLDIIHMAFSSSFGIFTPPKSEDTNGKNTWILADPDDFEESACDERIMVVMRDDKTMARLEKGGGCVGGPGVPATISGIRHLEKCIKLAGERWRIWNELIKGKREQN